MLYYSSAQAYIQSAATRKEKVEKIDAVIDALLVAMSGMTENEGIKEYSLDNGQTKIQTEYRSAAAVTASIQSLTKLKNDLINQGNRVVRLIDSKNLR